MTANTCIVSRLRHSLLQPTSAIGLILKSAADGKLSDNSITQTFEIAAKAAHDLHTELEALMDFLVLECGRNDLCLSPTNLHDIIVEAVSEDASLANSIGRLIIEDPHTLTVKADSGLLLKGIRALIKNAMEFSTGAVEVSIQKDDAFASILIEDRGIGIHDAITENLGEPFRVANAAKTPRATRMGVGLPIAKRVAEKHGGRLEVTQRPGGGSQARLTLPLAP